jgi:hypothetical protein
LRQGLKVDAKFFDDHRMDHDEQDIRVRQAAPGLEFAIHLDDRILDLVSGDYDLAVRIGRWPLKFAGAVMAGFLVFD